MGPASTTAVLEMPRIWTERSAVTTHVEFLPNVVTFCGLRAADVPPGDAVILARDWMPAVERVQLSNCNACLLKLYMLGDSAKLKLERMGMKVEVHDVDEGALAEN